MPALRAAGEGTQHRKSRLAVEQAVDQGDPQLIVEALPHVLVLGVPRVRLHEQLVADVGSGDLAVGRGRQWPGDAQHLGDGTHVDRHHAVQTREAGGVRRAHQVLGSRAEVRVDAGVGEPVGARSVRVVERAAGCALPGQLRRQVL